MIDDFGLRLQILLIVVGINLTKRDRTFILALDSLPILKYTVPLQKY